MKVLGAVGLLSLLTACAPVTQRPAISDAAMKAEAERQLELAAGEMVEEQRRIAVVYRHLATTAADLCGEHVGPNIGANIIRKPKGELGDTLERLHGIRDKPTVLFVLPGSPADAGGLRPKDVVHSINGAALTDADADKTINDALPPDRPISYVIARGAETISITVNPDKACWYGIGLDPQQVINAYADGRGILIARGMMGFARNDTELATVIAHEMAHNIMKHIDARRQNIGLGILADIAVLVLSRGQVGGSNFARAGALAYSQAFEQEADYVGLYIMARAGLPIADAPNFWRRMATAHPANIKNSHAASHPSTAERMLSLSEAVKEIEAKVQANAPLVPNVKEGKFEPPRK